MLGHRRGAKNRQTHPFIFAIHLFHANDGRSALHAVERAVIHILYDGVRHHAAISMESIRNGLASKHLI